MLQKSCCHSNLSLSSFYHLRICGSASLLGYPVMNSSRLTWVWPCPKTAAWSQKSRSLNWIYLCATFRYFVQARAWSLSQNAAVIKAVPPWLQVYPVCYCLPAWAVLARQQGWGTLKLSCPGEWQARRRTFTDEQLLPATSLWTEALLQSCTYLQSTLVSTTTSCRPSRDDIWGKKHLAFNQAGDWALQTFCTAKRANSSSSGV